MEGVDERNHLILVDQKEIELIVNNKVGAKANKEDQQNAFEGVTDLHINPGFTRSSSLMPD